jgi:hypothetical protein
MNRKLLSERQYAKHRGCARSTVQAARRTGRLRRSVSTDAGGRIWIDPEVADREWQASTLEDRIPLTGPTAPRKRPSPAPPPAAEVAEITRRLAAIVSTDCDETKGHVLELVPHAVEGAVEALRSARREPTVAALVNALRLDPDDEDAALEVSLALQAIVDEAPSRADAVEMARRVGSAAVLETKGGANDGNA